MTDLDYGSSTIMHRQLAKCSNVSEKTVRGHDEHITVTHVRCL